MTHRELKQKNFENYKFKVLNCLIHKTNLSKNNQSVINNCKNKTLIIEFVNSKLDKEHILALKESKIKPFYKGISNTRILYTPMGNKR
jgi:hypothetical protein